MLNESGINTKLFSTHSITYATSSAAYRKGFNIDQIKNTIVWTSTSKVFQKINRPLNKGKKNNFIKTGRK